MSFDLTLTFDNGPEPGVTPGVLAVLADHGIRATFFVIGEKLDRNEALAIRARAEGHWIGNHTWTHTTPLGQLSPAEAEAEITRTQHRLGTLAHPDRLFRPMGGGGQLGPHLLNQAAADLLRRGAYTCVLWNAVPRDWAEPDDWVDRALDQCREQDWTLMVLHDLPTGAMRHLPRFLKAAADAGARFRQDFPPACLPVRNGRATAALPAIVT